MSVRNGRLLAHFVGSLVEMTVYPDKMEFGWAGDGGLGDRLIQEIIEGNKTATCCPLAALSPDELKETKMQKDKLVTVITKDGTPRCNVRVLDHFETTFGNPDPRLVSGENAPDSETFREDHRKAWADWSQEREIALTDELVLFVEIFQFVEAR